MKEFRGRWRSQASYGEAVHMRNPTVFVDNLPRHIRKIWVYNLFSKFGKIRDIFIPSKRSKITGQSFGFIRFNSTVEAHSSISEVNKSWHWGQQLVVHFARYLRNVDGNGINQSRIEISASKRRVYEGPAKVMSTNAQYMQRGTEVWRRKGGVESSKQGEARYAVKVFDESSEPNSLKIPIKPAGNGWLLRSAIAKIKRLLPAKDLELIFIKEGIQNIQVRAIGGRFVIITFSDPTARDATIKLDWITNWFEEIKPWKGEQANVERFVWLECLGMPLNAWSMPTFKEIGNIWGHFLQVDDNTLKEKSFEKARILIVTEKFQKIEGGIELLLDDRTFVVRVNEEASFRIIESNFLVPTMEKENLEGEDDEKNKENDDVMAADKDMEASQNRFVSVNIADGVIPNSVRADKNDVDPISGDNFVNFAAQEALPVTHSVKLDLQLNNGCMDDMVSTFSSSGFESSSTGNERVLDGFESISNPKGSMLQLQLDDQGKRGDESMHMEASLKEQAIIDDNHVEIQDTNSNHSPSQVAMDHQGPESNHPQNPKADILENYNAPIQAAVKGVQGKVKRKNIDEILGNPKVTRRNQKHGKGKKKCVVFRTAIAAAALSASVSTEEISNRNRIILTEAQTIRQMNKLIGYTYDGEDDEVVSKIAELEAQEKAGAEGQLLASKSPALLDFHEDITSLKAASKIQLKSLAEEMQAIIEGLEKVKLGLAASENDGPASDVFHKTLSQFIGIAEAEVASVTNFIHWWCKGKHASANQDGSGTQLKPLSLFKIGISRF